MKKIMSRITIEESLHNSYPSWQLGILLTEVLVTDTPLILLEEMEQTAGRLAYDLDTSQISSISPIAEAREAYRSLGKDPARYRPSAEALLRRVVQGKGLYHINNIVDLLNLVSIETGFSIGGYDADRIEGEISLSAGQKGEPYEAIGRGDLNIHQLPVLRDVKGAFGSPTSDSSRTMVTNQTRRFLMVFFDFGANEELDAALERAASLLIKYGNAKDLLKALIR